MTPAPDIATYIKEHGPLTVADYMARCNAHYYATRDPFGTKGDFITAPEISQIFGELAGAWITNYWQQMELSRTLLCELGPGRGTLMKDALRATQKVAGFHEALDIRMIETSPALTSIQKQTLKGSHPRISWHESVQNLPALPLLLIANEFFDALPFEQFVGDRERKIRFDKGALRFTPEGKVTHETSTASSAVIKDIAAHIARFGGAALIIDYGYVKGEAGDTLQALKRHGFADPLANPGEVDLTAHVDFVALAEAARLHGVHIHGPIEQGTFLKRLGAELRAAALCRSATQQQKEILLSGLERLVAPHQMGELFKVMAVTSSPQVPAGFSSCA